MTKGLWDRLLMSIRIVVASCCFQIKNILLSVRLERSGMRAIVSGTGDLGHLKMEYVPTSAEIKVGEKVYSSGLGEHFPAGYLVGTISKISRHNSGEFAQIDVVPAAQLAGGHHVVVLFSDSLAMEQPHADR